MADNKYKNQFCFTISSIITNNYLICYYFIAIYQVSSMSKRYVYINWAYILCILVSWCCLFHIWIELVYANNVTAISSTMWNIAHASIKQNYIV